MIRSESQPSVVLVLVGADAVRDAREMAAHWRRHRQRLGLKPSPTAAAILESVSERTEPPVWLTRAAAARRAGVSPRTIDRWRADGLESRTVRGRVLVHADALDAFVGNGQE